MNNYLTDMRLILIDEDGAVDVVFSANDQSDKNTVILSRTDEITDIIEAYELVKDSTYKENNDNDKHLFYLKQYIKTKGINVNTDTNDDVLLYYYMTKQNYVSIIHSAEHINIITSPKEMSEEQKTRLEQLQEIFPERMQFSYAPNMHIERFKQGGQIYGTLDIGETIDGNLSKIVSAIKEKSKNK